MSAMAMSRRALVGVGIAGLAIAPALAQTTPERAPGALTGQPDLDGRAIVARAHAAAGGDVWVRPKSLHMIGEAVFFDRNGQTRHERYEMWRVYPDMRTVAHAADGRVRIESWRNGARAMLLTFDGVRSYTADGPQPPSDADKQWAENFGFGVIRYALAEGFLAARMPDDLVDGRPCFVVRITDPSGGRTLFSIAHGDFQIVRVAFATPRGWHERTYSDFFRKPGSPWVQPGRVRLTYDGVKQNEIFWRDFEVNVDMPQSLFVVPAR